MRVYADSNFVMALLVETIHSPEAIRLQLVAGKNQTLPFPITFLSRLEVLNVLQLAVFQARHGVPGTKISPEMALVQETFFLNELELKANFVPVNLSESKLLTQFQTLIHHHTAKEGFRTYDVLHVASAMVLGCDTFWSFDARAKRLAQLAGLAVN